MPHFQIKLSRARKYCSMTAARLVAYVGPAGFPVSRLFGDLLGFRSAENETSPVWRCGGVIYFGRTRTADGRKKLPHRVLAERF